MNSFSMHIEGSLSSRTMNIACSGVNDPRRTAYYVEQWCTLLQHREARWRSGLVVHQPSELENTDRPCVGRLFGILDG